MVSVKTEATVMLTSEVARRLACSTDYVRFHERSGQLHAAKTRGGVRLFDRSDVEHFARERAERIESRSVRR